jgi:hypothetical protein
MKTLWGRISCVESYYTTLWKLRIHDPTHVAFSYEDIGDAVARVDHELRNNSQLPVRSS